METCPMVHKELERIFRQWCIRHGIMNVLAPLPSTREEAERDLRILEWALNGNAPSPEMEERMSKLKQLCAEPALGACGRTE